MRKPKHQTFELPIGRNYIDNWGIPEALREIYANAVDGSSQKEAKVSKNNDYVNIHNPSKEKLQPSTLILGGTSKHKDDNHIGQFGEGYKLALVVLLREGIKVTIENHDELWIPEFKFSKRYNAEVLRIKIKPTPENVPHEQIISFDMEGISTEDMHKFLDLLLPEIIKDKDPIISTEQATVYDTSHIIKEIGSSWEFSNEKKKYRGIYVGGIRVSNWHIDAVVDLKPSAVKLSRDRDRIVKGDYILTKLKAQCYSLIEEKLTNEQLLTIIQQTEELKEEELEKYKQIFLSNMILPEDVQKVFFTDSETIYRESLKLGVNLPDNYVHADPYTLELLRKFGIEHERQEFELLDESLDVILEKLIARNMNALQAKGAESLYRDIHNLKQIAHTFWR